MSKLHGKMTASDTMPTKRYAERHPVVWMIELITIEKSAAEIPEHAITMPYTNPRLLMNQLPIRDAEGSTKIPAPAAPTRNPETCHCHISVYVLMAATAPDKITIAADMTIRVSYFVKSLPAKGVTSVVPIK